ncbi:uncharacterized protein H6S33_008753 [Morchella sextelata]|uniref:uncharacterized protein n=1 Tax=Morchella sextelata TaxID=1174677 RepID=UPI001D04674D|nr:uncharacterized protein H6S33_008753 [Morchella sextelata]KAH0602414.1 hypothetical protein H6S33_008753 [Morchella sextelata]
MSAPGGGLQDLNALPLPSTDIDDTDVAFNPDDLAIFTNTRFFDFDIGPDDRRNHNREGGETGRADLIDPELKNGGMDFLNDFDPYGYDTYPFGPTQPTPSSPNIDRSFTPSTISPSTRNRPVKPLAPLPPPPPAPASEASSPGQSPYPSRSNMRARKASTASSSDHIQSPSSEQFGDEPVSRAGAAVDEDKRRRNTAASARFRVKKKEKEAQLAKDAKDAAEKVRLMEARIKKLEEQNEWLKSLLLEKKRAVSAVTKDGVGGSTPSGNDKGDVLK